MAIFSTTCIGWDDGSFVISTFKNHLKILRGWNHNEIRISLRLGWKILILVKFTERDWSVNGTLWPKTRTLKGVGDIFSFFFFLQSERWASIDLYQWKFPLLNKNLRQNFSFQFHFYNNFCFLTSWNKKWAFGNKLSYFLWFKNLGIFKVFSLSLSCTFHYDQKLRILEF